MKKIVARTLLALIMLVPIGWVSLATYFMATTSMEHLIICATDKRDVGDRAINLPSGMCEYYLLHFRGSRNDIDALEQGTGLSFAFASEKTGHKISNFLIQKKINVNKVSPQTGLTPMIWAVSDNNPELIQYLLQHGADVNIKGKKGFVSADLTPLELVNELIQKDPKTDRSAVKKLLEEHAKK